MSQVDFAVVIETLALRFQQSPYLTGISLGGRLDTIGLYADDLILYLQDASGYLKRKSFFNSTYRYVYSKPIVILT